MKDRSVRLLSVPFLLVLVALAVQGQREANYLRQLTTGAIQPTEAHDLALAFEPSLFAGRRLARVFQPDATAIEQRFEAAVARRPLYAPAWLDLAEHAFRQGDPARAAALADHSLTLWANRTRHLWRVGVLRLRLGDAPGALDVLSRYALGEPGGMLPVLVNLQRAGVGPDALIEAFAALEPEPQFESLAEAFLVAAIRLGDSGLARSWWTGLPDELRVSEGVATRYLGFGLAQRDAGIVCTAHAALSPQAPCVDALRNANFEQALADGSLDWDLRRGAGYRFRHRTYGEDAGLLKIEFDGEENLQFRNVRQWLPLSGEAAMAVALTWRGESVTTRSGLYLDVELLCLDGSQRFRSEPRRGTWRTATDVVVVPVVPPCGLARVGVARDRTGNLDRNLGGTVWLEGFEVRRASDAQPVIGGSHGDG